MLSNYHHLIDALPYYDKGYDEAGVREASQALVEEETKTFKPTKNYLQHLSLLNDQAFETDIMRNEFTRLEARKPMEMLSWTRYELPIPPTGSKNDVGAWEECVKNSQAQLMQMELRSENLEAMMKHSCNAWKTYNELLDKQKESVLNELQHVKQNIKEINWQRKNLHVKNGEQLDLLESKWVELISKNYEIEEAIMKLEKEIAVKEAESNKEE